LAEFGDAFFYSFRLPQNFAIKMVDFEGKIFKSGIARRFLQATKF